MSAPMNMDKGSQGLKARSLSSVALMMKRKCASCDTSVADFVGEVVVKDHRSLVFVPDTHDERFTAYLCDGPSDSGTSTQSSRDKPEVYNLSKLGKLKESSLSGALSEISSRASLPLYTPQRPEKLRNTSSARESPGLPKEYSKLTKGEMFSVIWQYAGLLDSKEVVDLFARVYQFAEARGPCNCNSVEGQIQCTKGCLTVLNTLVNRKLGVENPDGDDASDDKDEDREGLFEAPAVFDENTTQRSGTEGMPKSEGVASDAFTGRVTAAWTRFGDEMGDVEDDIDDDDDDDHNEPTDIKSTISRSATVKIFQGQLSYTPQLVISTTEPQSFKSEGMAYLLEQHKQRFLSSIQNNKKDDDTASASDGLSAVDLYERSLNMILNRNVDKAVEMLQLAIELDPEHAESLYTLGLLVEQQQGENSVEAEIYYNRAIGANPTYANALCRYALLLSRRDDDSDAVIYLQRAIEADPNHEDAITHLGILADEEDDHLKALQYLDQVIPNLLERRDQSMTVQVIRRYAMLLEMADRDDDAFNVYDGGLELNPDDYATLVAYALLCHKHGKADQAEKLLARAKDNCPNGDPGVLRALMLEEEGRLEEAVAEFEASHALGMKPEAKVHYAGLLAKTGNIDRAAQLYVDVIETDEVVDTMVMGNFAVLLASTGQVEEALKIYNKIVYDRNIEDDEEDLVQEIVTLYLRALEESGQVDKARDVIEYVCKMRPGSVGVHLKRADFEQRQNNLALAAQYLNELMQKHPFNADVHIAMAQLYSFNDQKRYAESIFRDALRKVDEKYKVAAAYGRWLHGLGFFKLAEPLYLQCLKDHPEDIDTLFKYVLLLKEKGAFRGLEEKLHENLVQQQEQPVDPSKNRPGSICLEGKVKGWTVTVLGT